MPDEIIQPDGDHQETAEMAEIDVHKLLDALKRENEELRAKVSEVNNESASRRLALKKQQEEMERLQAQQLAEQGKWKELAEKRLAELEELKPIKERYEAVQQAVTKSNEARIASIPENMRALVPADYSPDKLSQWLDANLSLLTVRPAPNLDGGVTGGGGKSPIRLSAEEKQMAARLNLSEDEYAKYKATIEKERSAD